MAVIKCKMCGGNIEIDQTRNYGTCDSCGSVMTLPKVSDEKKVNLFNRANHFRRLNDFDKAILAYEGILNEDHTDAEAHWGVVLSRYGIEYVEDPISHKRIPTCHRVQYESILIDPDYLMALEYAPDGYSRSLYEQEAKQINEIQREILSISRNETSYDVFICYKETTDAGTRTKDSVLAQDIYFQLANDGYKVFFSKISLENQLGEKYEPYIFAALNSAKVMVVIGTKAEYFNAVWVRNEWSRYLDIVKKDRTKLLIPCYKDMDPYDLPIELSALQSLDMSKIGFIQDLIRGIRKSLQTKKEAHGSPDAKEQEGQRSVSAAQYGALLKRAFLCIEDSDYKKADDLLEKVLNTNPECAEAYVGKLLIDLELKHESDLSKQRQLIDKNSNYQKAVRFAEPGYRATLQQYHNTIIETVEQERKETIYQKAEAMVRHVREPGLLIMGAKTYESIAGYKDSDEKAEKSRNLAKEAIYQKAESMVNCMRPGLLIERAEMYESIAGYKDSDEKAEKSRNLAVEMKNKMDEDIFQQAQVKRQQAFEIKDYNQRYRQLLKAKEMFLKIPKYKDGLLLSKECQRQADEATAKFEEQVKLNCERRAKKTKRIIKYVFIILMVIGLGFSIYYIERHNRKVTMIFHTKGGSVVDSVTQKYGTPISIVPSRDGYAFIGWYLEDTFKTPISTVPSRDVTLYARYARLIDIPMVAVGQLGTTYTIPTGTSDSGTTPVPGGYLIATTETTYELWYEVRIWAETNGYLFQNQGAEGHDGTIGAAPNRSNKHEPVTTVSWHDAIVWMNAASEMSKFNPVYRTAGGDIIRDARDSNESVVDGAIQTGNNGYRLPTTYEWEMAARWRNGDGDGSILVDGRYWTPGDYASGATADYNSSSTTSVVAWYRDNSDLGDGWTTHPVGEKTSNHLGLYDMSGNVWEWTYTTSGSYRIIRGGSCNNYAYLLQVGGAYSDSPNSSYSYRGFRLVRGQ